MAAKDWKTHNASGKLRVVVTKQLPGKRWLEVLTAAGCRVEVCTSTKILSNNQIKTAIGKKCDGVIGQLARIPSAGDRVAGGRAKSH